VVGTIYLDTDNDGQKDAGEAEPGHRCLRALRFHGPGGGHLTRSAKCPRAAGRRPILTRVEPSAVCRKGRHWQQRHIYEVNTPDGSVIRSFAAPVLW